MRTLLRTVAVLGALAMTTAVTDASGGTARPIVVIDAPSNLGLRPPSPGREPGVRHLPRTLRALDLVARLHARDGGSVPAPPYSPEPDLATGFRNGTALAAYTRRLAMRVGEALGDDAFVLLLGGDCSVLLGPALALRQRGRFALAFIDAHDDFSYIRDRARYAGVLTAAGLDLALATGHGPAALVDIDGRAPYLAERDVVHFGRAPEPGDARDYATETFDASAILAIDRATIRRDGVVAAIARSRERLADPAHDGFWIHLDADVLDAHAMPAVDSPSADGLTFAELEQLLGALLRNPRARGLEVTILDPDLDPDGHYARAFADMLVAAFVASGRVPRESPPY